MQNIASHLSIDGVTYFSRDAFYLLAVAIVVVAARVRENRAIPTVHDDANNAF